MRIFKNAWFERFARKENISDAALAEAVTRAEGGLVDADLGGGVIKQRVARSGAGKSGGYRTLLFFQANDRAIFAYGFAKSDRENIDAKNQAGLKRVARVMLGLSEAELDRLVVDGTLSEVGDREERDSNKNLSERDRRLVA